MGDVDVSKFVILFTSTISPGSFDFVGRVDVKDRLDDYLKSFNFYRELKFRIVWIDNSNYNLCYLNKYENVEFFYFDSIESKKGKGHGEFEIMEYGFSVSNFLKNDNIILKISGRYIIKNILSLISNIGNLSIYQYCNFSRNFSWADTRLIVLDRDFYVTYFRPTCKEYLNEKSGVYFEMVYARALHLWQFHGKKCLIFDVPVYFYGFNGQTNLKINLSLYRKIKYYFFNIIKTWVFRQTI